MRNALIFGLLLFLYVPVICGQELLLGILPAKEGKITYAGSENVPGMGVEKLHENARVWFAAADKVSSDSIVSDTPNEIRGTGKYKIRAKGVGLVGYDMDVLYSIILNIQEGVYSYTFTDLIGQTKGKFGLIEDPMENWNSEFKEEEKRAKKNAKVYPQVNTGMNEIIESLKKAMKTN